jgi:hypothetical protein
MRNILSWSLNRGPKCIALLLGCAMTLQGAVAQGWHLAGSKPESYEAGTDLQASYNDHPSAYLKSTKAVSDGFGTLMQEFTADKYAGKRLRLSAFVKTEDVKDWAGLWMRVDKEAKSVAFDNMENRSIKGTTGWQHYQVVLDAPQDATGIFFGVLLSGSGTVWLNDVKFEVVGSDVPTTGGAGAPQRSEPVNLGFDNP